VILDPDPTKIRLRPYRGRFEEQMAEALYIEEADDVLAYIHCFYADQRPEKQEIEQRYSGMDIRNGWHSWLISLRGSPILWADKQVPGIRVVDPVAVASEIAST
jgi:hypothetical protein